MHFFWGWSLRFHPIFKVPFLKRTGSACRFLIGFSALSLWWTSLVWPCFCRQVFHWSAGSGLRELLILQDRLNLKAVVQSLKRSGGEWKPGEASPRQKQMGQATCCPECSVTIATRAGNS